MALVASGFEGSITLVDTGGNRSRKEYSLRAATYTEALADLQAILALLMAITDAVVEKYRVVTVYSEDAFAYPTGNVQVENIAEVVLLLSTGVGKTATHQIPAPIAGIFQSAAGKGYNVVDVSDSGLFAYIDGTFSATDGVAYISDGETVTDLAAIQSGKRVHRASRRG